MAVVAAQAATVSVDVGPGGNLVFAPQDITVQAGDTVVWTWQSDHHTVTSGLFDSGLRARGATFSFTFQKVQKVAYDCTPHGNLGMVGSVTVSAAGPAASQPLNISTRMRVQTGENVMIGGFIVTGNVPKKVIVRAMGPSLAQAGIADVLADPVLELRASDRSLIRGNDNWKEGQQTEIQATGVAPQNDLESAVVITLNPGSYTAVVSGKSQTSGVGLVEVYDLDQTADSKLANISTRGFVLTGANVMIGGFILGNGSAATNVIVRGIGPSLSQAGVSGALADPTLELRDANGGLVRSNDNWKDSQQAEIQATGVAPQSDFESAIVATLNPAAYTAIVTGKNGGTGVALVEVFRLP